MQVPAAFILSLAGALIATGAAIGDEAPPDKGAPATEAPGGALGEAPQDSVAPPASGGVEAARRAHMDALFAELASPVNENWQRTEAQIHAAWAESGSASMDFLAARADEAMAAHDLDTALGFLNDLVRLAPDYAEGWNKRATLHFRRDDYALALEDIARTLALEPRHFGAYAGLGIILDRLGDKKGALEAYRRAVEIHPHLPGAAEGIRKLTREVEGDRA